MTSKTRPATETIRAWIKEHCQSSLGLSESTAEGIADELILKAYAEAREGWTRSFVAGGSIPSGTVTLTPDTGTLTATREQ